MNKFNPRDPNNLTPDQLWEEFWKEICTSPDGSLNLEAIKNELSDYSFLLDQVPIAYDELSNGRISKPNTYAFEVINANREYIDEFYIYKEDLEEEKEHNPSEE